MATGIRIRVRSGARWTSRWLVAFLLLVACGKGTEGPTAVTDEAFVEAMSRLVLLDLEASLPSQVGVPAADPDSAREAILAEIGVSPEELLDFAERLGRNPERMESLWARIQVVVDSAFSARRARSKPEARGEPLATSGAPAREARVDSAVRPGKAAMPEALPPEIRRKVEELRRARTPRDTSVSP